VFLPYELPTELLPLERDALQYHQVEEESREAIVESSSGQLTMTCRQQRQRSMLLRKRLGRLKEKGMALNKLLPVIVVPIAPLPPVAVPAITYKCSGIFIFYKVCPIGKRILQHLRSFLRPKKSEKANLNKRNILDNILGLSLILIIRTLLLSLIMNKNINLQEKDETVFIIIYFYYF
jgi:hypothetical protein